MQLFHKRLSNQRNIHLKNSKIALNNNLSPLRYRETCGFRVNKFQEKQYRTNRQQNQGRSYRPDSKASQQQYITKNHHYQRRYPCDTHPQKQAQYCYNMDHQKLFYCCLCAAKLASQGYTMQKIIPSMTPSSKIVRYSSEHNLIKKKQFPHHHQPQYYHPPQRQAITPQQQPLIFKHNKNIADGSQTNTTSLVTNSRKSRIKCSKHTSNQFIQQLNSLSISIDQLLTKYTQLISNQQKMAYDINRQRELITKFYEKIVDIALSYKERHLKRIEQMNLILTEKSNLKENIKDLYTINQDMLQTDFDEVIEKVSKNDFKACFDFYKSKYSQFQNMYNNLISTKTPKNPSKNNPQVQVQDIQQNIDKIQNLLKKFYEPSQPESSQISSTNIQNLLKQYQKRDKPKLKIKNLFSCQNRNQDYGNITIDGCQQ